MRSHASTVEDLPARHQTRLIHNASVTQVFKGTHLGLVYTMDYEVGPWKMASFHGLTSWSNFHGPISLKTNLHSLCAPD